ncbi:MAG: hypothetical protein HC877_20655 [Thioploca sp.]|nr:hypothetical protein [Thioploca sp.]
MKNLTTLEEFLSNTPRVLKNEFRPRYQKRLAFLTKEWSAPPNKPFSTKGREWVIDLFRALEGFKSWPVDINQLCETCSDKVDEIIDHPLELSDTHSKEHFEKYGCKGLEAHRIIFHILDCDRRSGKTFNISAFLQVLYF